jgi:RNA polymerase sigma-70 factor (ECF subfamily)
MPTAKPDTEELLERARRGDDGARDQLLVRQRERLRRFVAVRFDRRLTGRLDPSDVVQEVLAEWLLRSALPTRSSPGRR